MDGTDCAHHENPDSSNPPNPCEDNRPHRGVGNERRRRSNPHQCRHNIDCAQTPDPEWMNEGDRRDRQHSQNNRGNEVENRSGLEDPHNRGYDIPGGRESHEVVVGSLQRHIAVVNDIV